MKIEYFNLNKKPFSKWKKKCKSIAIDSTGNSKYEKLQIKKFDKADSDDDDIDNDVQIPNKTVMI